MEIDDIRRKTCLIVRKNGEYLAGWNYLSRCLKWSNYTYEAWRTRDRAKAELAAEKTGGTVYLYYEVPGGSKKKRGGDAMQESIDAFERMHSVPQ